MGRKKGSKNKVKFKVSKSYKKRIIPKKAIKGFFGTKKIKVSKASKASIKKKYEHYCECCKENHAKEDFEGYAVCESCKIFLEKRKSKRE